MDDNIDAMPETGKLPDPAPEQGKLPDGDPADIIKALQAVACEQLTEAARHGLETFHGLSGDLAASLRVGEVSHDGETLAASASFLGEAVLATLSAETLRRLSQPRAATAILAARLAEAAYGVFLARNGAETSPVAALVPDQSHQEPRTSPETTQEDDGFVTVYERLSPASARYQLVEATAQEDRERAERLDRMLTPEVSALIVALRCLGGTGARTGWNTAHVMEAIHSGIQYATGCTPQEVYELHALYLRRLEAARFSSLSLGDARYLADELRRLSVTPSLHEVQQACLRLVAQIEGRA